MKWVWHIVFEIWEVWLRFKANPRNLKRKKTSKSHICENCYPRKFPAIRYIPTKRSLNLQIITIPKINSKLLSLYTHCYNVAVMRGTSPLSKKKLCQLRMLKKELKQASDVQHICKCFQPQHYFLTYSMSCSWYLSLLNCFPVHPQNCPKNHG